MRKMKKKKKTRKKTKNTAEKKEEKKEKRAQKSTTTPLPRWAPKLFFYIRTVKRNRNEIEAPKKSDFEHPTKKKKMKDNERK